jgi:hypothetical protein
MAFFSTPEVEWLYSGVTITKPSNEAILAAHSRVCGWLYWAIDGGTGLVEVRQLVVEQVDQLELRVGALRGHLEDPLGDGFAVAARAGAAEDDADLGHDGYVKRIRCERDGRGLNAVLTDSGLERLRQAWPTHLASVRRHVVDHLEGLDLDRLATALEAMAGGGCPPCQSSPHDVSPR